MLESLLPQTFFLGAAGEVPFDDLTAGVVSTTDATSVLLLVRRDLAVTTHMLRERGHGRARGAGLRWTRTWRRRHQSGSSPFVRESELLVLF